MRLNWNDKGLKLIFKEPMGFDGHWFTGMFVFLMSGYDFCNHFRRRLSENFYVNFSCWTYWFLLVVYFSYLGFGAWMFVKLEQPTEQDKCEFVNEFDALYANAGEEYVWSK